MHGIVICKFKRIDWESTTNLTRTVEVLMFRRSMAADSSQWWDKSRFELIQAIIYTLVTYKYQNDWSGNNKEMCLHNFYVINL